MSCPEPLALSGWALAMSLTAAALLAEPVREPEWTFSTPRFERLTNREGLSQNTVYTIEQDRKGFLWFGTKLGLDRYDGYGFETYAHEPFDPGTFAGGFVRVLHQDRTGALWIGTNGSGLDRFDPVTESFVHYRHHPEDPSSLADDDVRSILEDRRGALWVGTRHGGLHRFVPETETFVRYRHDPEDPSSLADDDVRSLYEDSSGTLWIGTYGGLDRFDGDGFVHYRHRRDDPASLIDDRIRAICGDRLGGLWIGTNGGLDYFDPATGAFTHYRHDPQDPRSLSDDRVRSCLHDRSGQLWIGTRSGLNRFDGEGFTHYRPDPEDPSSLSDDAVYAIFEDPAGGLWIGTYNGGINRFDPDLEGFAHVRHDPRDPSSLSSNQVTALYEDRDSRLWVGTFGGGLDRLDRRSGQPAFTHYRHDAEAPGSLADDRVRCLHEDRDGRLWVGTFDRGLSYLDRAAGNFVHYRHDPQDPSSLSNDDVRCLAEDRSGRLWVGTYNGGLNRLDRDRRTFTRFRHRRDDPDSLASDRVRVIYEDRSGRLWIGSDGGLDRLESDSGTGVFTHFRHDPRDPRSLSHDAVSTIHEDPAGRLWIGTYGGGLNRLDLPAESGLERPSFVHYSTDSGLGDHTVFGILEDRLGRLWMSTGRGLVRFDPAADRWTVYDVRDGLQDVEFNAGAFHRGPSGAMYFGGIRGFNAFRPEAFGDNAYVPPVVLTSFKVYEREVALGRSSPHLEEIELGWDANFFSFEFAALNFRRSDRNRYRYRLEGLDDDWIDPGSRRYASYTKVPPGTYVFRVKGSNNDGLWNEEGVSTRLIVRPPPWRTWWAYLLYFAALAASGLGLARHQRGKLARERAIAERERALNRHFRELAGLKDSLLADRAIELEERERLIAELEARNVELERFTYTVSHDLKSPLVTIKGFLGLLERDSAAGDRERVRRDVGRIAAAADTMTRLLEDLLELSRIGRVINRPEEVAVGEVVEEACEFLAGAIADRRAEIEVAPDLPTVWADRARLLEVYQNLIENAIKHTGDGAGPRIEVGWRRDGSAPIFFVRDDGVGIAPQYHGKIFGLFERLDTGTEGTGVGLALVKRIVEVHGGRIWIESDGDGRGATFCFSLADETAETGTSTVKPIAEKGQ